MIKKNITINFCGRLYNIDEDAFELLNHYTETIRRYYAKEGTEDVADDIESRIAELLDEQIASGKHAIDIDCTQNIINRIGELKDIAPDAEPADDSHDNRNAGDRFRHGANSFANNMADKAQNAWDTLHSDKRFYRDMQYGLLGGVLAGCAQYFGGSLIAWRVLFLLVVLVPIPLLDSVGLGGIFVFVYLVLVIIAPKAERPEDVLRMQGKDVTPQNLADEVARQNREPRNSGNALGKILKLLFILISIPVCLWLIFMLCMGVVVATSPVFFIRDMMNWINPDDIFAAVRIPMYFGIGALIVASITLIYCTLHAMLSAAGKIKQMNTLQRTSWLIVFIGAVIIFVASLVKVVTTAQPMHDKFCAERNALWHKEWVEQHTHDGIEYNDDDWEYFNQTGFRMIKAENCLNGFTSCGEYFDGDVTHRYFDAYSPDGNIVYHSERTDSVPAGTYKLSCIGRASEYKNGANNGVCFYALVQKEDKDVRKYLCFIPAYGNVGKAICRPGFYALPNIDMDYILDEIDEVNDGKGFGWAYMKLEDIKVPEGAVVKYGISTDKEFTGEKCTAEWFSVCDLELTPVTKL